MKVLIDACVLYPTVLREIVLGLAGNGAFEPVWSERILEEWRRAAVRQGDGAIAEAEIAAARALFPHAAVGAAPEVESRLNLPDPDDVHVLASAIVGECAELLTLNLKDFPTRVVGREGVIVRDPDGFLLEQFHADGERVTTVLNDVLEKAARHGIDVSNPRKLMKRARLPRLGKAIYAP